MMFRKVVSFLTAINFLFLSIGFNTNALAQESLFLPPTGKILPLSPTFTPMMIKGIKIHQDNPFQFDFIINKGEENLYEDEFKDESLKLIKYFLASLTIPEKDLWVNLSPYEKNRITTPELGNTAMGRDLLAQDYVLKQLTSSLIYPESALGKKFWDKVYLQAQEKYHNTNIPINTFNKVWIMPQKGVVYENSTSQVAYVLESKLKVMLEEDYLAMQKHQGLPGDMSSKGPCPQASKLLNMKATQSNDVNALGSSIVREIVIPELTKEVNEGANFANLRQVTNSLILAAWFKRTLRASILSKVYVDQKKTVGVDLKDRTITERIYQQYLQAYKKGVYNYIKEDEDPSTHQITPRKYFSGGVVEEFNETNLQVKKSVNPAQVSETDDKAVTVQLDNAMTVSPDVHDITKEAMGESDSQLPYGPVDGPKGLSQKLSGFIQNEYDLKFSKEQVLVSPDVETVVNLLGRIIRGGTSKIKTIEAEDYKNIHEFKKDVGENVPSVIRLKPGAWNKELVYQFWLYARDNHSLLFIEENAPSGSPQHDPIENFLTFNHDGGGNILRYISLANVNPVIARTGLGVLATHNEGFLHKYKALVRNSSYMNLPTLATTYLLKSRRIKSPSRITVSNGLSAVHCRLVAGAGAISRMSGILAQRIAA